VSAIVRPTVAGELVSVMGFSRGALVADAHHAAESAASSPVLDL
jgi:hypothetical protein